MWGNNVQWTGKSKNKKGKPEEGNPWAIGLAKVAVGLLANWVPDTSISCPVGFMVGVWVVFGVVISQVFATSIPVITKLVLRCAASKPPKAHIHHLGPAGHNRFVGNTAAVELSVCIGVFGSGHPMAMRVCLWGIISRAVMKRAASSDSAAEAITNLMIWAMESMAPLKRGNGSYSERKM
jgi:hypothetical protein